MMQPKTILVAPLNWGLGHATRCIPIIHALIKQDLKVLIASDGAALQLLEKEFPQLETVTLPSYNIRYPKNARYFKTRILFKTLHILKTIKRERQQVATMINEHNIVGIISDNRWGVRNKKTPSIFLTHQIQVLSGNTTKLTSAMHQRTIKKFNWCWVPDVPGKPNLSGVLGHANASGIPVQYIGSLSRMKPIKIATKYDILILLSGPEPQRSLFEEKLIKEFKDDNRVIYMVRGVIEKEQTSTNFGTISAVNFLTTEALEKAINQSKLVISRSGYTTIMDLSVLGKKVFFVPTPGQYEQEYLAKKFKDEGIAPYCDQEHFSKEKVAEIIAYSGFKARTQHQDFKNLFSLFHGE